MKILAKVIAGIFAGAIGAGIIWYEWRQLNPRQQVPQTPAVQQTIAATTQNSPIRQEVRPAAPETAGKRVWFKDLVVQKADEVAQLAQKEDSDSVAADELNLPRAALPFLQAKADSNILPAAASQSLKRALESDAARLKLAKEDKQRIDWFFANTLGIFDKTALPDAHWRQSARSAIGAWGRVNSGDPGATGDEGITIWYAAREAAQEACPDPLLLYIHATNQVENGVSADRVTETILRAERGMANSKYPKAFQLYATLYALQAIGSVERKTAADRVRIAPLVDRANALFPQAISDPDLPDTVVIDLFEKIGEASLAIYGDRRKLAAPMFDQLEKSKLSRSLVLTIKGAFNVTFAWDARGSGYANTITPEGARLMRERLAKAAAALEEAWKLDNSNKYAATEMISCELGQGQGKDRMELWFNRAIAVDPLYYNAYANKLYYLEPKWYGSQQEMLDFARKVSKSAPPDSDLRIFIAKAHRDLSQYSSPGDNSDGHDKADYFKGNATAWKDIHDAYMDYLPFHAEGRKNYLRYAELAAYCGQWEQAHWAFMQVPVDYYDWNIFQSADDQNKLAETATQQAAIAATRSSH
jgi:hypothetical protein